MLEELSEKLTRPISEVQLLDPLNINANEDYFTVCKMMRESGHGIASIYSDDQYLGALLESSLVHSSTDRHSAGEMAVQFPFRLHRTSSIIDALQLAIVKNTYYLPVFNDEGKVDGYLSIRIIMTLIMEYFKEYKDKYGTLFVWDNKSDFPYLSKSISLDESRLSVFAPEALELPLSRVSSNPVTILDSSSSIVEVLSAMKASSSGIVVLTKFGTILDGIITERDYMTKMSIYSFDELVKMNVSDFMTKSPDYLNPNFRIIYAINNIVSRGYRNVLLADNDKMPVSTISMVDILRFILENLFPTNSVK